jgi:acetyltransferase-like isoleucine patch superfamily enzyme
MTNNLDSGGDQIGGAKVGANCFIGTNTVLQHGISIADGVTTGSMSFVNKDIKEAGIYFGNPAKKYVKS